MLDLVNIQERMSLEAQIPSARCINLLSINLVPGFSVWRSWACNLKSAESGITKGHVNEIFSDASLIRSKSLSLTCNGMFQQSFSALICSNGGSFIC